ncbi:hypothetical protein A0J61_10326 [Choanephora cucurbitarum]|uniref:FAR1 domain-containing protein n=1 Tax=Choanephora cucurbitarum TaxID=101091 RepID=A0A1C7MXJ7_9FUNG|nr:hypothetical protein A0J61_10326 [Choanephora cucurbitarum]
MNSQLSLSESQLTVTNFPVSQNAIIPCKFNEWDSSSDEEYLSSDKEEVPTEKVFFVGANFESMEEIRSKAQDIGSQFNCPITTVNEKGTRHYKSGRHECPMRVYVSKGRDIEKPREVRRITIEHNHSITKDLSAYPIFRKLAAEDFDFTCE